TRPKRRAAARVALPLPAATSSTRSPERTSTASHRSSPTICSVVPITAKSPDAHMACCLALIDGPPEDATAEPLDKPVVMDGLLLARSRTAMRVEGERG